MAGIALIVGTLFWLTIFLCLMVAFYVVTKGGFGAKAFVEATLALVVMVVLGVPLSFLARKLSGRAMGSAGGPGAEEVKERGTTRRVNRRSRPGQG